MALVIPVTQKKEEDMRGQEDHRKDKDGAGIMMQTHIYKFTFTTVCHVTSEKINCNS